MTENNLECVPGRHHQFRTYNDTVDVISGWETVFSVYKDLCSEYYFDRFPQAPADDIDYSPDFSVNFKPEYGILAKILPQTEQESPSEIADSLLTMCEACDSNYGLKTPNDSISEPDLLDIMAFVPDAYSSEFGNILDARLKDEWKDLEANVVLLRYGMDDQRANYVFQRETALDDEFREEHLPDEQSLSETIGPDGGYKSYKLGTKEFLRPKTKKPIYNLKPPESYLATYLWMKVFPEELTESDFEDWRKGVIQKIQQITVNPDDLTRKLNTQRIDDGDVETEWVDNSLQFLSTSQNAEEVNGRYDVNYTGLVHETDISGTNPSSKQHQRRRELAITLIKRYCKFSGEAATEGQSSLEDFE